MYATSRPSIRGRGFVGGTGLLLDYSQPEDSGKRKLRRTGKKKSCSKESARGFLHRVQKINNAASLQAGQWEPCFAQQEAEFEITIPVPGTAGFVYPVTSVGKHAAFQGHKDKRDVLKGLWAVLGDCGPHQYADAMCLFEYDAIRLFRPVDVVTFDGKEVFHAAVSYSESMVSKGFKQLIMSSYRTNQSVSYYKTHYEHCIAHGESLT